MAKISLSIYVGIYISGRASYRKCSKCFYIEGSDTVQKSYEISKSPDLEGDYRIFHEDFKISLEISTPREK